MTQPIENEFLTPSEVARTLKTVHATALAYIRSGQIPASRIGRRYVVRRSDLDAFVAARRVTGTGGK
jgi:excisionase family DNA binding protein